MGQTERLEFLKTHVVKSIYLFFKNKLTKTLLRVGTSIQT